MKCVMLPVTIIKNKINNKAVYDVKKVRHFYFISVSFMSNVLSTHTLRVLYLHVRVSFVLKLVN